MCVQMVRSLQEKRSAFPIRGRMHLMDTALVLVAIVLVFSFMLKGGEEEPKLVPVQVDGGAVESLAV